MMIDLDVENQSQNKADPLLGRLRAESQPGSMKKKKVL